MFSFKKNNLIPTISDKFRRSDTNKVYLFTNARDEPNIAEWIAHHILLGFDKVIVFDHLSNQPIAEKLGTNFDNKLIVNRVQGTGNIKIELMKKAVNIADNNHVSWMLYLDADEFLLLKDFTNVHDYLLSFKDADSIGINWLMFGSSGFVKQPSGLITENFIRSEIRLNQHVKSFVRPSIVKNIVNPHYYILTNSNRYVSSLKTRIRVGPFNNQPLPFINANAYIAHYYIQSEEEHLRRKGRALDDGSPNKLGIVNEIHSLYNTVANNQLQNKYSHNIKHFLKKYGIVL